MVRTLLEHRPIYSWLFLHGGEGLVQRFRDVLGDLTRRNMAATDLDRDLSPAQVEVAVAYAAGGFVNVMTKYFGGVIDMTADELTDAIVDLSPAAYRGDT